MSEAWVGESLHALDAGRRAGWARAYDARTRAEGLYAVALRARSQCAKVESESNEWPNHLRTCETLVMMAEALFNATHDGRARTAALARIDAAVASRRFYVDERTGELVLDGQ